MIHPLITAIRRGLREHADPVKAPAMQRYMKSAMPYYGIQTPQRRAIEQEVFSAHSLDSFVEWRDVTLALWRGAKFREERYAAIGLTGFEPYDRYQTLKTMPMYEEMIVDGAWWDFVDGIAINRIGHLLRKYPGAMKKRMRAWNRSRDMWKRRTSIICQVTFKAETDLELLYDCICATMHETEFFIRKAIGWALREYAWTDPDEVVRFVTEHAAELAPLSKREALKNVLKSGRIARLP